MKHDYTAALQKAKIDSTKAIQELRRVFQGELVNVHEQLGHVSKSVSAMKQNQKKWEYDTQCILKSCENVRDQFGTNLEKIQKLDVELEKYQTNFEEIHKSKDDLQQQVESHKQQAVTKDELNMLQTKYDSMKEVVDDLVSNKRKRTYSEDMTIQYKGAKKERVGPWHNFKKNECVWHHDTKKNKIEECLYQSFDKRTGFVSLSTKDKGKPVVTKKINLYVNECSYGSRRKL